MTYHVPPDDYRPPTHCELCEHRIALYSVAGGRMWLHVSSNAQTRSHGVRMRSEGYWDSSTGETRQGNGLNYLVKRCPRDTNGDGDCGQHLCPYCGESVRQVVDETL